MNEYFVALDTTSDNLSAAGAKWLEKGGYELLGLASAETKGIKNGVVLDQALAADSIVRVIAKLEKKTGNKFKDVYSSVTSPLIHSVSSSGMVLLSKYGREIEERDIKKCVEIASAIRMPLEKEFLHKIVRNFSIDGEKGIKSPVGLEGVKLSADVDVMSIDSSVLNNLRKCISLAAYVPAGFVFAPIASAYRALPEEDTEKGALLLNVHRNVTDAAVFSDGVMTACKIFPRGTKDMTDKNVVSWIVSQINSIPERAKVEKIVIAGEGSMIDSLVSSLGEAFAAHVEIAECIVRSGENLPPERRGYITSLGVLDYFQKERQTHFKGGNPFQRAIHKVLNIIDSYF